VPAKELAWWTQPGRRPLVQALIVMRFFTVIDASLVGRSPQPPAQRSPRLYVQRAMPASSANAASVFRRRQEGDRRPGPTARRWSWPLLHVVEMLTAKPHHKFDEAARVGVSEQSESRPSFSLPLSRQGWRFFLSPFDDGNGAPHQRRCGAHVSPMLPCSLLRSLGIPAISVAPITLPKGAAAPLGAAVHPASAPASHSRRAGGRAASGTSAAARGHRGTSRER
jgi:hypothetical protein